jgi:hypothetical protein
LAAVLVLVACGGKAKPVPRGPEGPPYLALFERGRSWSLPAEVVHGERRGDAYVAKSTERGDVRCDVADVKQVGHSKVSRIECAPPYAGLLIVGTWVATPAGLYHPPLPVDDADELAVGSDDLLLTAKPQERGHIAASGAMQHSMQAFANGDSWCAGETFAAQEERRSYLLCLGAAGITGGSELVMSGDTHQWHRMKFGAAPDDSGDPTSHPDD